MSQLPAQLERLLEFERQIRRAVDCLNHDIQESDYRDERDMARVRFSNAVKNAVAKLP